MVSDKLTPAALARRIVAAALAEAAARDQIAAGGSLPCKLCARDAHARALAALRAAADELRRSK